MADARKHRQPARAASRMSARLTPAAVLIGAAALVVACTSSGSNGPSTTPSTASSTSGTSGTSTAPTSTTPTTSATGPTRFASLSGRTTLRFASSFVRALYTDGLSTSPAGDAKLKPVGRLGIADDLVLPVTAGSLTVDAGRARGRVAHAGSGLTVHNDSATLRLSDFTVTLSPAVSITARVAAGTTAGRTVTLFTAAAPRGGARSAGGRLTLAPTSLYLTSEAGSALDDVLDTTLFESHPRLFAGTFTSTLSTG